MRREQPAVGIDLGTTFSALSYIDARGQPQMIRITDDEATLGATSHALASAVYFRSAREVVVGNRALDFSVVDPARLASRFKRQMGADVYHQISPGEAGVATPFVVDGQTFRPEELSALVLKRLKAVAEEQLGPIREVVISVPFVFDELRRRATQAAGQIAGFERIELVDEPVAAAIALGHNLFQGAMFQEQELQNLLGDQRILVYDLGGGTFDATVVQVHRQGVFEVLATAGDERLGGTDWDAALIEILATEFETHFQLDPRPHPALMQSLLFRAIEAKETLSRKPRVNVQLEHDGRQAHVQIPVQRFERQTRHLVARTTDTILSMLQRLDWGWSHCDRLLVVGGASRMPMVLKHLRETSQREIDMSLPPDTAVATGAALFAALKFGHASPVVTDVQTVNSHALGLLARSARTGNVVNDVLIPQNTRTRTRFVRNYRVQDPRKGVTLVVLQGDSPDPRHCLQIGRVQVDLPEGTTPSHPGTGSPEIAVTFEFQDNGLLWVEGLVLSAAGSPPARADVVLRLTNTPSDEQLDASASRNQRFELT